MLTKCGSVAGYQTKTNRFKATQGIMTSNRFEILQDVSDGDNPEFISDTQLPPSESTDDGTKEVTKAINNAITNCQGYCRIQAKA